MALMSLDLVVQIKHYFPTNRGAIKKTQITVINGNEIHSKLSYFGLFYSDL